MHIIYAHSSYETIIRNQLSFDKNQKFYVLNYYEIFDMYYVSTDNKLPFSDDAISGFVPCAYFDI